MSAQPPTDVSGEVLAQPIPGLAWYSIGDPASPALDELARRFALHELQIEDCRHRPQRAKTEDHERYIFSVLKHVRGGELLRFDDLDVFLGSDFLVTVSGPNTGVVEKIRKRTEGSALHGRLDKLFYVIIDVVVDEYLPVLDRIAEEINEIENVVLVDPQPAMLRRILRLKRKLIDFRRNAGAMREVVSAVMRKEEGLVHDDLDPYFRDVYDHLVRTTEMIETYRDLLTGSLDIYLTAVANRTSDIVKVLTIYGIVTLPFVVVTGFFGMNLHLPWAESRWGALIVLFLMVGMAGGLFWYFRIRKLL